MSSRLRGTALFHCAVSLPPGLAIVGSRWFSKIEVGPIYVLDVALLVAFVCGAIFLVEHGRRLTKLDSPPRVPGSILFLVLWATIVMLVGDITSETARAYAPYLYLSYGALVFLVLRVANLELSRQLAAVIKLALVVHWAWVSILQIVGGMGSLKVLVEPQFLAPSIRPDFDGALLGLLAALLLKQATVHGIKKAFLFSCFSVLIFTQVALLESRAAHVSAFLSLLLVIIVANWRSQRSAVLHALRLLMLLVVLAAHLAFLPIGEKWNLGLNFSSLTDAVILSESQPSEPIESQPSEPIESQPSEPIESQPSERFSGSTQARWNSWILTWDWIADEPTTALLGDGFGSDYFADSGAAVALLGSGFESGEDGRDSKHPHNFVFSTSAYLGIPFAFLLLLLMLSSTVIGIRFSRRSDTVLNLMGSLVICALFPVMSFGVVLETPFGAILLAWALGVATVKIKFGSQQFGVVESATSY